MPNWVSRVEAILDLLNRYHVRASYGAVAGHVGVRNVRTYMDRFPREPRYSWVVSGEPPHEPSGYPAEARHPHLTRHRMVLTDKRELAAWMRRKLAGAPLP